MDREAYRDDADVRAFLDWAKPLVTGDRTLDHSWASPKWGTRSFETLYDAYEQYEWKFSVDLPERGKCEGKRYKETVSFLTDLKTQLRESQEQGDMDRFLKAANAVLEWGHVYRSETLSRLGDEVIPHLTANADRLDPARADLDHLVGLKPMSAGFSKLYSLLVDCFPIYDSRVACALASLVRWFCHERGRDAVPETLKIGVPLDRASVCRDPSCKHLSFKRISPGSTTRYARSNVMAAWLLGELAKHPPFCGEDDPLHALQSAMFMIGYKPLASPADRGAFP